MTEILTYGQRADRGYSSKRGHSSCRGSCALGRAASSAHPPLTHLLSCGYSGRPARDEQHPAWRADHPRVKHPIVNKGERRMHTNKHEYPWTSLAAAPSWEEAPPGSAGVPPAQHWHSLSHLLHPARPATAPRFCFSRAQAVAAGRVAGCHIAGKPSGTERQCMRARRPRSPEGCLLPSFLLREKALALPMRQCRPASCVFSETPHRQ